MRHERREERKRALEERRRVLAIRQQLAVQVGATRGIAAFLRALSQGPSHGTVTWATLEQILGGEGAAAP